MAHLPSLLWLKSLHSHISSTLLLRYKLSQMVLHCGQALCADDRLGNLWLRERGYGIASCVLEVVEPVAIRRVRPLPSVFCRREFYFPTIALVSGVPINRDFADAQLAVYRLATCVVC